MFYTYILYSAKINKFYTGQTENIQRRLEEHNLGKTPFMNTGKPWILIYSTQFSTRSEAVNLEKIIKKRGAERFLNDNNISVE